MYLLGRFLREPKPLNCPDFLELQPQTKGQHLVSRLPAIFSCLPPDNSPHFVTGYLLGTRICHKEPRCFAGKKKKKRNILHFCQMGLNSTVKCELFLRWWRRKQCVCLWKRQLPRSYNLPFLLSKENWLRVTLCIIDLFLSFQFQSTKRSTIDLCNITLTLLLSIWKVPPWATKFEYSIMKSLSFNSQKLLC